MKSLFTLLMMTLAISISSGQIVTDKNLGSFGYGEKKMKKAPMEVFVHRFSVHYQVLSSGAQTSTSGKTRAEMAVALDGVTPDIMQRITDNAYKRMVDKLEAAGYVVKTADQVEAEMFSDWIRVEGGEYSMNQLMGFVSTMPTGQPYLIKGIDKKGKAKSNFFDVTPKISKQVGDIPVLEANINFQFVTIEGNSFINEASKLKGIVSYEIPESAIAQSADGLLGNGSIATAPTIMRIIWKGGAPGAGALSNYTYIPKKGIEIPGVVESKKFKEYVSPSYNYNNNPYSSLVFSVKKDLDVSHVVKTDAKAYEEQTQQALNEYIDKVVDTFIENSKG